LILRRIGMSEAQRIFDEAFAKPRDPRSAEYKLGVLGTLRIRVDGEECTCPYRAGTAESDAYWAGAAEGLRLSRIVTADAVYAEQTSNVYAEQEA
jgi:hypothetical protein